MLGEPSLTLQRERGRSSEESKGWRQSHQWLHRRHVGLLLLADFERVLPMTITLAFEKKKRAVVGASSDVDQESFLF